MGFRKFAKLGAKFKRSFKSTNIRSRVSSPAVPNGFLDVKLGDSFSNGRYLVKKQLGTGRYANVWLAQDHQYVPFSNLYDLTVR